MDVNGMQLEKRVPADNVTWFTTLQNVTTFRASRATEICTFVPFRRWWFQGALFAETVDMDFKSLLQRAFLNLKLIITNHGRTFCLCIAATTEHKF
jgi:hypothetical protein